MSKKIPIFFFVLSLLVCFWVYLPGLSGFFLFDDAWNINQNQFIKINQFSFQSLWNAMMSGESGPLKRPISMLSFAINHYFTGMNPYWMKLTNLIIHLLNGIVLCLLLKEFLSALNKKINYFYPDSLAYFISAAWLLHPINVSAVSYIVQRMTSLATFFMLLGMYIFLLLRKDHLASKTGYFLTFIIILVWALGIFSKEFVALFGLFLLFTELRLYQFNVSGFDQKRHLVLLHSIFIIPIFIGFVFILINYQYYFITSYDYRNFTLYERVLTECRVVLHYIKLTVLPDIGKMDFFQDDVSLSKSLFHPFSTFLSLVSILLMLGLSFKWWKRFPLFSFGLVWFFIGHLIESSVLALEISFLHRNYLPSIGILLILTEVIFRLYCRKKELALLVMVLFFSIFLFCTRMTVWQWSDDISYLLTSAIQNPGSLRANTWAGNLYTIKALKQGPGDVQDKLLFEARKYHAQVKRLKADDISVALSNLNLYLIYQQQPPEQLVANIISDIRTADLGYSEINIMLSITNCMIKPGCLLDERRYTDIINEGIHNQGLKDLHKSFLLSIYSKYLYEGKKDLASAINVLNQAIATDPSLLENYIKLIKYYELEGSVSRIRTVITELEKNDRLNMYNSYIKDLKTNLN